MKGFPSGLFLFFAGNATITSQAGRLIIIVME